MHDACHKLTLAIWSHKDNINGKQGQHVIFKNKIEVFFRIKIYIINKIDLLNLFFHLESEDTLWLRIFFVTLKTLNWFNIEIIIE